MIGERIKKLRKALDLTQQEFSERIGIKRNTIAKYETNRGEPIDAVISLICREFRVSEAWLRAGEGDMLLPEANAALELLVAEHNLTVGDRVLIEKFLNLKPETRRIFVDYAREVAAAIADESTPAQTSAQHTPTIEEEARAEADRYYQALIAEKKQESQASTAKESGVG